MARYKAYEIDQTMMLPLDFKRTFPDGTFERFLVETIGRLDLARFAGTGPDAGGETPYDPRALLGVVFYGFSTGTYSSRSLSAACANDLRYIFVAGGCAPEHTTICRFLVKHRAAIKDLFTQILYIADNVGLIDYKMIAIDGSKIKGNASRQFTGTVADFKAKRTRIETKIEQALQKQATSDDTEEVRYWRAKTERYEKTKKRIDAFLEQAVERRNEDGSERHQSGTDGDCRILKSHGEYVCGYNGQVAIDTDSGLLTGAEIVDQSNDKHAFSSVVESLRTTVPTPEKIDDAVFLADNGYFSPDTLEYAREKDLDIYISDRTTNELYQSPETSTAKITAKDCQLETGDDGGIGLRCPGNRRLDSYQVKEVGKRVVYRFSSGANNPACRLCPVFQRCAGRNASLEKEFEIDKRTIVGHAFIKRHHEKLHSDKGKRIYSRRMSSVERVFGNIKGNGNFRTFFRRGLDLVGMEWKLLASAFNLRRMFTLMGTAAT